MAEGLGRERDLLLQCPPHVQRGEEEEGRVVRPKAGFAWGRSQKLPWENDGRWNKSIKSDQTSRLLRSSPSIYGWDGGVRRRLV